MPIIRPHAARFHERRISSVMFTLAHLYGNVYIPLDVARALADSSDFGLLGEQSSQKWETPCPGRRWTAAQSLTPLALFSAEKSVTVQTNKQTVNDISTPCLSARVDNKVYSSRDDRSGSVCSTRPTYIWARCIETRGRSILDVTRLWTSKTETCFTQFAPQWIIIITFLRLFGYLTRNNISIQYAWMNENARILSAFENRLRAGFV